jgi:sn-glycerol 3-phosphate transport system permease protein
LAITFQPIRVNRRCNFLENIESFLYLLPILYTFGIFFYYPLVRTFLLSFSLVNSMGVPVSFNGTENYIELLSSGSFWNSLGITLRFVLMVVPVQICTGIFLAVLAEDKIKKTSFLYLIFAMRMAVSSACASLIWLILFNLSTGIVNWVLNAQINWQGNTDIALIMIAITTVWIWCGPACSGRSVGS